MIDIILVVLVNLFLADTHALTDFYMMTAILLGMSDIPVFVWCIYTLLGLLIILFIKLVSLPLFYSYMEKKSKNLIVRRFIQNLKANTWVKFLVVLLPFPLLIKDLINGDIMNQSTIVGPTLAFLFYFLATSWVISYISLFIYWKIQDR